MTPEIFQRLLAPIQRRISNIVYRCVINAVSETGALQKLKVEVLKDEVIDNVEAVRQYGFISSPKEGAEGVVLFLGGDRTHGVIIATEDRRYRLTTLSNGDVAIYDDQGQYVWLKRSGNIEVKANTKVTITSPNVETSANLTVKGNLTVEGTSNQQAVSAASVAATGAVTGATVAAGSTSLASVKSAFNGHTHTETGGTTNGPNTSVP